MFEHYKKLLFTGATYLDTPGSAAEAPDLSNESVSDLLTNLQDGGEVDGTDLAEINELKSRFEADREGVLSSIQNALDLSVDAMLKDKWYSVDSEADYNALKRLLDAADSDYMLPNYSDIQGTMGEDAMPISLLASQVDGQINVFEGGGFPGVDMSIDYVIVDGEIVKYDMSDRTKKIGEWDEASYVSDDFTNITFNDNEIDLADAIAKSQEEPTQQAPEEDQPAPAPVQTEAEQAKEAFNKKLGEARAWYKEQGANMEDFKELQTVLKDAWHNPGTIDGKFGPATMKAIVAYQKANQIESSGQADEKTLKEMWLPNVNEFYGEDLVLTQEAVDKFLEESTFESAKKGKDVTVELKTDKDGNTRVRLNTPYGDGLNDVKEEISRDIDLSKITQSQLEDIVESMKIEYEGHAKVAERLEAAAAKRQAADAKAGERNKNSSDRITEKTEGKITLSPSEVQELRDERITFRRERRNGEVEFNRRGTNDILFSPNEKTITDQSKKLGDIPLGEIDLKDALLLVDKYLKTLNKARNKPGYKDLKVEVNVDGVKAELDDLKDFPQIIAATDALQKYIDDKSGDQELKKKTKVAR